MDHQPGHLIDLLATCLDVSGGTYPDEIQGRTSQPIQGRSLAPLFKGQQREPHEFLYFQFSNNRAIRKGDWKAVSARGGRWELFNFGQDRSELNDLASQHPKRAERLQKLWHEVAETIDESPKKHRKPVGDKLKTYPPDQMTQRKSGPKAKATKPTDEAKRNNQKAGKRQ